MRTVTTCRSFTAAIVAASEPPAVLVAAQVRSAPLTWNPACSLYSVRSMARHWVPSTLSAVTSSSSFVQVTTACTCPVDPSGERSEQAAVGLPEASVLEFETRPDFAASGIAPHRSAGTSGDIGFNGGGSDPPQPARSSRPATSTLSPAPLRGIRHSPSGWSDGPHSTTAESSGAGPRLVLRRGQRQAEPRNREVTP